MTGTRRAGAAVVSLLALVTVVAVALVVARRDSGPAWTTARGSLLAGDEITVGEGIGLRFGDACAQVVAGDAATPCSQLAPGTGTSSAVELDGRHVVLVNHRTGEAAWNPEIPAADRAVVWSSASPQGRTMPLVLSPDGTTQSLVWEVGDGEEPWGVQVLDASGALLSSIELVGLPAP